MDEAGRLQLAVADCRRRSGTAAIVGHGSKTLYGPLAGDETLSTQGLAGIVDYRPEELVVTALAGTPIADLTAALAEEDQILPFDPPRFDAAGTFGGAVASGLSGPARPWRGGVRDAVLGVEIVNGRGERLRFGGSVMKNVAGYDVSRLMAGARGSLGLILAASVRLLPRPPAEETLVTRCDAAEAGRLTRRWARQPLPITATCFVDGALHVRLSGSVQGVAAARADLGMTETADPDIWAEVRDHEHAFFQGAAALTRWSLPRGCRFDAEDALIEWGGCQAWSPGEADEVPEGAYATTFAPGRPPVEQPGLSAAAAKIGARLKQAFDPDGLFNPGVAV